MSRALADGRVSCSHLPEPHVVYRPAIRAYSATIRCRCRLVEVRDGGRHASYAAAEDAAKALLAGADKSRL